jgi:preprotein translocase subunit SecY
MFRRFILAFTDPELRTKLIKIGLLIVVARLLTQVPVPVLDVENLSGLLESDAVFNLLNVVSGGGYGKLSFVMLGVGPYITASIVMQLLGVIIPRLNEIQKEEGEMGQQKINRWTRYLVVPLSALNAWGIIQFLTSGADQTGVKIDLPAVLTSTEVNAQTFGYWFAVIASMVAGSIIMMYIGEVITEFKMGNGISILILAGIISNLPKSLYKFVTQVSPNFQKLFSSFSFDKIGNPEVWKALLYSNPTWDPVRQTITFIGSFLLMLLLVVFVNDAVRKLTIVYSRRGHIMGKSRTLDNVKADLPVKVNMAGVIPIIFAVSFILFPSIISRFLYTSTLTQVKDTAQSVEKYLSTNPSQAVAGGELPEKKLGVYTSQNIQQIKNAQNFDQTEGHELL